MAERALLRARLPKLRPSAPVPRYSAAPLQSLICILLATACTGDTRDVAPWTAFDSAGVEVVVSNHPVWQEADRWRLDQDPLFRIGEGPEENHLFSRIVGAFVTGRGEVVVGNGDGGEIRFYTLAGEHVRTVGREGEGPGEYRRLASIHPYVGDSILTMDVRLWRIGVMGPDGSHGRYIRLNLDDLGGRVTLLGADTVGDILVRIGSGLGGAPIGEIAQHTESLVRMESDGTGHRTVASFPGPESVEVEAGSFGAITTYRPFGRNTLVLITNRGVITHYNAGFRLERREGGEFRRILRMDRPVRPLTQADIESAKAEMLEDFGGDQARDLVDAFHAPGILPATLPAWDDLFVDPDGYIWAGVTPSAPPSVSRMWDVFSPEGYLLGSVSMPQALTVTEIGRDYVLGYLTDDLDVEHLVMYALRRE